MIRRPPRSTLFPTRRSSDLNQESVSNYFFGLLIFTDLFSLYTLLKLHFFSILPVISFLISAILVDRKSTRLNSSHLGISYAVFCLKKKKYIYILFFILLFYI